MQGLAAIARPRGRLGRFFGEMAAGWNFSLGPAGFKRDAAVEALLVEELM